MYIETILKLVESPKNHNEIFVVGTTFTGTVLAIFFTLIALPIQNILSRYSQDLIKRVSIDTIFVFSFSFLIITFTYNLILVAFGASREFVIISLGLTISSVLVLALLVVHTFYLLDVRNQLNDITRGIQKKIKSKIRKSEKTRKKGLKKWLNLK